MLYEAGMDVNTTHLQVLWCLRWEIWQWGVCRDTQQLLGKLWGGEGHERLCLIACSCRGAALHKGKRDKSLLAGYLGW
eukprot:scaffold310459_cov19-Tisochrysis_lutea.AAC.1